MKSPLFPSLANTALSPPTLLEYIRSLKTSKPSPTKLDSLSVSTSNHTEICNALDDMLQLLFPTRDYVEILKAIINITKKIDPTPSFLETLCKKVYKDSIPTKVRKLMTQVLILNTTLLSTFCISIVLAEFRTLSLEVFRESTRDERRAVFDSLVHGTWKWQKIIPDSSNPSIDMEYVEMIKSLLTEWCIASIDCRSTIEYLKECGIESCFEKCGRSAEYDMLAAQFF